MSTKNIMLPQGIEFRIDADKITIKGQKGEVSRKYPLKFLEIKKENSEIFVLPKEDNPKTKALIGTFKAHLLNMIKGVQEPFTYKLKICIAHFPISVAISGQEIIVQNYLGEKRHKKIRIPENVKVKIAGEFIDVESPDIEAAGKMVTLLEQCCKLRKAHDKRIFQDGIYLVERYGKPV